MRIGRWCVRIKHRTGNQSKRMKDRREGQSGFMLRAMKRKNENDYVPFVFDKIELGRHSTKKSQQEVHKQKSTTLASLPFKSLSPLSILHSFMVFDHLRQIEHTVVVFIFL